MSLKDIYTNGIVNAKTSIIKPIKAEWDIHSNLIKQIALTLEPKFQFTDNNKQVYRLALQYFTGDSNFELQQLPGSKKYGSLSKGLGLVGGPGCGKSLLSNVFKIYTSNYLQLNSYQLCEYTDIVSNSRLHPNELSKFGSLKTINQGKTINVAFTAFIDDFLSIDGTINHYGTKIDGGKELLNYRYQAYCKNQKLTHFTTNIYPEVMKEILDERLNSRLLEMCNLIEFQDCDWRRNK